MKNNNVINYLGVQSKLEKLRGYKVATVISNKTDLLSNVYTCGTYTRIFKKYHKLDQNF